MIAGIIGATGYGGAELVRLLLSHPDIDDLVLASVSHKGESIASIYPNFTGLDYTLTSPEECIAKSGIVFGALPAGTGETYAKACLDKGISYLDLSADFRFDMDEKTYQAWYGADNAWQHSDVHNRSVYGLPEFNRERIKQLAASGPVVIGNPGCYPTAVSLACYPALANRENENAGLSSVGIKLKDAPIIADAVSGVTGAGRETTRFNHFPECADSISAYKVGAHRHTPEINRTITKMADRFIPLVFTPHLGPINRGILATVYMQLDQAPAASCHSRSKEIDQKEQTLREYYEQFYQDEPFVRILSAGVYAATGRVRHSNYCDISVHLDHSGSVLIVESAIDNMVKGAAGQAIQNMNIICGFNETAGLTAMPALF